MSENNENQSNNIYEYQDGNSSKKENSKSKEESDVNQNPNKESTAVRRSINENDQMLNHNFQQEEQNEGQTAVRRSIGNINPNIEYPNYNDKSSENRFDEKRGSREFLVQYFPPLKNTPKLKRQIKEKYPIAFIILLLFEILIIILIGTATELKGGNPKLAEEDPHEFGYVYEFFKNVNLMIFLGFGILYTSLKCHQWSSLALVLFLGVFSIQISFFWNYLWGNAFRKSKEEDDNYEENNWSKMALTFENLIQICFIGSTVIISLGAIIGKFTLKQYIFIASFETFFASLSYYLCNLQIGTIDNGGSTSIHLFGAINGVLISIINFSSNEEYSKIKSSPYLLRGYKSNIVAFIGTLFLWVYFPSFNTAVIQYNNVSEVIKEILRYRGICNTYFSMIGATIGTFITSPLLSNGVFSMFHLLNASYVGGIIIGGCCTICSAGWGALLIGFIGGCLSILGLKFLRDIFKNNNIEDTFGVLFTFGIPGFLGGILNCIFIGNFRNKSWGEAKMEDFFDVGERSISEQAGLQIASLFVNLAIAIASGGIIGFILKSMVCEKNNIYFVDTELFVETGDIALPEWDYPRDNLKIPILKKSLEQSSRVVEIQQQQ